MQFRFLHNHTPSSALNRLGYLLSKIGVAKTLSAGASVIEEDVLHCFDRLYRVRTSGYIPIPKASVDRSKLVQATGYGPVNAWAFRRLLKKLALPRQWRFADLGSGLGRPCILAAEYGFARVTGVEMVQEFCVAARENISHCRLPARNTARINIVHGDVLDYCDRTDDDVLFMYRPFHWELFCVVIKKMIERANCTKPVTIIYTERLMSSDSSYVKAFSDYPQSLRKIYADDCLGQSFHVFQTVPH